ncbi:amino acid adenylation domain-containing protein [Fibrella sp. WM1]|uniref:amino acid adenylation domain-containing protein n=1 Tax=Fibrella musci TaxID=3242485 RepID=UPI0035226A09
MTEAIYPLTPLQENFLYVSQTQAEAYVVQSAFAINYTLQPDWVAEAIGQLTRRHDLLRTAFVFEGLKRPYQVLLADRTIDVRTYDLSHLPTDAAQAEIARRLAEERTQPFELAKEPLLRVLLLTLQPDRFVVALTNHHILMDAQGVRQLMAEFVTIYQSLAQDTPLQLPAPTPFRQYVEWLETQDKTEAAMFWQTYLQSYLQTATLAPTQRQTTNATPRWAEVTQVLPAQLTSRLGQTAVAMNATLPTLLQRVWGVLLGWYNQTQDVTFGTVSTVRPVDGPAFDHTIGLFTNTVPVRVQWTNADSVYSLTRQGQRDFWTSLPYQHLPLSDIQAQSLLRDRLFDHLFVVDTMPGGASNIDLALIRPLDEDAFTQINYDFGVLAQVSDTLQLRFTYRADRYEPWLFENLAAQFQHLLEQIVTDPTQPIGQLNRLPAQQQLSLWAAMQNPTHYETPETGLFGLFQQSVAQYTNQTAIQSPTETLTYGQLVAEVDALAGQLFHAYGVRPDEAVVVWADRSVEQLIAWLALLKLGATYVPVAAQMPAARVLEASRQTNPRLILTDRPANTLPASTLFLNELRTQARAAARTVEGSRLIGADQVAYIIFTSGTTGIPKGVQIAHRSFGSRIQDHITYLAIQPADRVLYLASTGFDAAMVEAGMALFAGATLCLADAATKDNPALLGEYIDANGVTVAIFPPAYLNAFDRRSLPTLTRIITTGEEARLAESLFYAQTRRVINGYGPTETCVGATFFEINPTHADDYRALGHVPIGAPFADTTVLVLDKDLNLLPEGAIGDLYVGGIGLSTGYLNDPAQTDRAFIENPFESSSRLYRTGDRARWHQHWGLEYFGRNDKQVQVRGIRVELQDIESNLIAFEGVTAACVVAQANEQGDMALTGYVETKQTIDLLELRTFLQQRLPIYAIPAVLVPIYELPLTANGKVDVAALPNPAQPDASQEVVLPQNELESQLLTIWQEVLETPTLTTTHNFFQAGGHSLKAMRLVAQIYKRIGTRLNVAEVFNYPTVVQLAGRINAHQQSARYEAIQLAPRQSHYAVSAAQRRFWMLAQFAGAESAYHIQQVCELTGPFDSWLFELALGQVVERHEILRTSFHFIGSDLRQVVSYYEPDDLPFRVVTDIDEAAFPAFIQDEQQAPLPLDRPSAFRVCVVPLAAERHVLVMTIHHILVDGASLQQLTGELFRLYNAHAAGQAIEYPPLAIQNKDVADWQNSQFADSAQPDKAYWLAELANLPDRPMLPVQQVRPVQKTFVGHRVSTTLTGATYTQLKRWAVTQQTSVYNLLMSTLYVLLYRYSGQTDLLIGTPVSLRQHPGLDEQIGLYLNTLVVRATVDPSAPFTVLAGAVQRKNLANQQHALYPYDQMVADLSHSRTDGSLFDVMLSHQQLGQATDESLTDLRTAYYATGSDTQSKFDWEFFCFENPQSLDVSLVVDADLYDLDRTEQILRHFVALLTTATTPADAERPIGQLLMLSATEQNWLDKQSLGETQTFGTDDLVTAFRQQVQQTPQAVAVWDEATTLTYQALDDQSDALATYLQTQYGIGPGSLVGMLMPHSSRVLTALLAILKLGAAFSPLDISNPADRHQYMLDNAGAQLLLTDSAVAFTPVNCPTLAIDRFRPVGEVLRPTVCWTPTDRAYVIYTSGSTGRPKGASISMGNLMNYLRWSNQYYFADQGGYPMALFTSIAFDLTITTLFSPLLRGDGVRIYEPAAAMNEVLAGVFAPNSGIRAVKMTPSHVLLLQYTGLSQTSVSHIIVGGEALLPEHVRLLRRLNPAMRIFNEYGPTETTVGCAIEEIAGEHDHITIGRPIVNTQLLVLTAEGEHVPVGGVGELYVGGEGVGIGYINQPDATSRAFRVLPQWPGSRLYQTGDLARWLPDGRLDYLGRKDKQVKINGRRIELAEIEAQISRVEGVEQVAVTVAELAAGSTLQAFVKWQMSQPMDDSGLRQQLRQWLPEYMVPARFITVDVFPLTPNGKLDYRQLVTPPTVVTAEMPRTETEQQLQTLWTTLLDVLEPDIRTSFFHLGGHSIKAIQLQQAIQQQLGYKLPLNDIYQRPTIAELAEVIDAMQAVAQPSSIQLSLSDQYETYII